MIIETDKDFNDFFKTDFKCRAFLKEHFWFDKYICPYCGHEEAYIIEDGKRFKCKRPECYKKYSITTGTFLEDWKTSLTRLFKGCWYIVCNGRESTEIGLADLLKINPSQRTASIYFDKFMHLLEGVDKFRRNKFDIFKDVIRNIYLKREDKYHFNPTNYLPWMLYGITDITERKQYEKVVKYARRRILCSRWIYILDFVHPEEIVTDVWCKLEQDGITQYNASYIATMVNRCINKAWYNFTKSNPQMYERSLERQRKWRKDATRLLKKYYIKELISAEMGISRTLIHDPEIIESVRQRIKEKRKKWGTEDLYNYKNELSGITNDEAKQILYTI